MAKSIVQMMEALNTAPSAEEELRARLDVRSAVSEAMEVVHAKRWAIAKELEAVVASASKSVPEVVIVGLRYAVYAMIARDNECRLSALEATVLAKTPPSTDVIASKVAQLERMLLDTADQLRRKDDVCARLSGTGTLTEGSSLDLREFALRTLMLRELQMVLNQRLAEERRN